MGMLGFQAAPILCAFDARSEVKRVFGYTWRNAHGRVFGLREPLALSPQLNNFREQLTQAVGAAHERKPFPGKANGVVVLAQPILIEAYIGLMSFIGNQNKLGYCIARGNIGF